MMFEIDSTAQHRPLGFVFGAGEAGAEGESVRLGWVAVDGRVASHAAGAGMFAVDRATCPAATLNARHLEASTGRPRAVLVHAGIANVATGADGDLDSHQLATHAAAAAGLAPHDVLLAGTGRICQRLPHAAMEAALPDLIAGATADRATEFARAILTTDRQPKVAGANGMIDGHVTRILGIAKGSPLLKPDLATLLMFLFTDAPVAPNAMSQLTRSVYDGTLRNLDIDGTPSPADSLIALSSAASGAPPIAADSIELRTLQSGLIAVAQNLVRQVVRDGGRATPLMVAVSSAPDPQIADTVARAVATNAAVRSSLVRRDGEWTSVYAAVTTAWPGFEADRLSLHVAGREVLRRGVASPPKPPVGRGDTAAIRIDLGSGSGTATIWSALPVAQ